MSFSLKILGSNSATPAYGRHHTAQVLNVGRHHFLIDCGEGTQERLVKYKVHTWKINHIFISHLHGDHYLGLMGFIFTMHLLKRNHDLHLYGQRGLEEIILTQLKYSDSKLNYKIIFHELNTEAETVIFEDAKVSVSSFPLDHRIPCCGFLFKEKSKPYRINKEKLPADIPLKAIAALKKGKDYEDGDSGIVYSKKELTLPPRKSRSYAFCSDTKYCEKIIPIIRKVDLLYHETTFLKGKEQWAELTFHSTTEQAGLIAKQAKVGKLISGHYSARYRDLEPFFSEVKTIFPNSQLSIEGETIEIDD